MHVLLALPSVFKRLDCPPPVSSVILDEAFLTVYSGRPVDEKRRHEPLTTTRAKTVKWDGLANSLYCLFELQDSQSIGCHNPNNPLLGSSVA